MSLSVRSRFGALLFTLLLVLLLALSAGSSLAKPAPSHTSVGDIELLGYVFISNDLMVDETLVGGLSGLVYDSQRGVYYALSDDKGEDGGDPRFYTLDIDVSDGSLEDGDVHFQGVTFLRDHRGHRYGVEAIDPEGFELARPGQLFIGSEGNIVGDTQPFIDRFNPSGKQNRALPIPDKFVADPPSSGARDNLVYESLTATPNGHYLYAGTENALAQDGPIATNVVGSPSRVIQYSLHTLKPMAEFVYCVEPIPVGDGGGDNGLVELQALDNHGTFLAMERSFVFPFGNTVRLFEVSTHGATDVSDVEALGWADCPGGDGSITPMAKEFLADFNDLGVDTVEVLDNMEGMAFGPPLPDGRLPLIVVSDNNFNPRFQDTIFVALAVELESAD
ncbi:MAG: esterase-like activity of phytase family protein [Candidatus Promineifilaceae bacterium]|nr:esterase-like activity of phytase family protein [Candidatus Promineifilaceae bacterium]